MCVCVCVCVCVHIYATSRKYLATHKKCLFLILKLLFLLKQVKHHNGFIHYTLYKSSWATLNTK